MPEVSARLLATYSCQLLIGVTLLIVFQHFSKQYNLRFLTTWSWSWLAFSAYMLGMCILVLLLGTNSASKVRTAASLVAQIGCFLQCYLLIIGAYELRIGKLVSKRKKIIMSVAVVSLAILSIILYNNSTTPESSNYRYLLRFGLRSFVLGSGFLISGIIIHTNSTIHKGLGQRLLVTVFLIFCVTQFGYFGLVLSNYFGIRISIPSFFGLVDLMTISMIGFSMVMWLLEDERARLDKVNRELDSFLYTTSHDLRAPLASILGLTNLAKFEVTDKKATEYIQMIESRTKKLDKVIGDILLLAKTIKSETKIEKVDFTQLVNEITSDEKYRKGSGKISIVYEEHPDHFFLSDFGQLKIIIRNLFTNALKYHNIDQENPYIKIDLIKMGGEIIITVEDNGEGIAETAKDKIFDMFYRASIKAEGTGLGLYLVKEAVNKLGGSITLNSKEGEGSKFTVRLKQVDSI